MQPLRHSLSLFLSHSHSHSFSLSLLFSCNPPASLFSLYCSFFVHLPALQIFPLRLWVCNTFSPSFAILLHSLPRVFKVQPTVCLFIFHDFSHSQPRQTPAHTHTHTLGIFWHLFDYNLRANVVVVKFVNFCLSRGSGNGNGNGSSSSSSRRTTSSYCKHIYLQPDCQKVATR